MVAKISLTGMQLIFLSAVLIGILTLALIVTQSYFNSSEINLLVEQAEQRNLDYELVIHNQFTNSYSFNVLDKGL